jgi:hypothetical protein
VPAHLFYTCKKFNVFYYANILIRVGFSPVGPTISSALDPVRLKIFVKLSVLHSVQQKAMTQEISKFEEVLIQIYIETLNSKPLNSTTTDKRTVRMSESGSNTSFY